VPDAAAPVAVLGAGSWGTALALLLAGADDVAAAAVAGEIRLWDRTPALVDGLRRNRENRRYLPGFPLPAAVLPRDDIAAAVAGASCVVVAVPSGAVGDVLAAAAPHLPGGGCDVVLAAKGLEGATGRRPSELAADVLEGRTASPLRFPVVALSGPNLAVEVARGVPTAAVAASPDGAAAERARARFSRKSFRVYTGADRTGVEIGGAVKNVLAIAGGVSDGLGYGDNTKAALLTRGLAEMARLGVACGARRATFYGLSGVGDLLATAASRLSRNWRVGEGLAKGEPLPAILARLGQVAEGVTTARAVQVLSERRGVEMPVCRAVGRLLFDGASPAHEVAALLARAPREEEEDDEG
jgi:glycerol-3-phosphate dehydrogenase (NAD(P)+)